MLPVIIEALIKIAILIAGLMTAAAYLVLVERWIAAWVQDRRGPNRVGVPLTKIRMFGLGQPIADGVKFIFKEEFTPDHVDKVLYFLSPVLLFVAAMVVYAAMPFGTIDLGFESLEAVSLSVAPGMNVGLLYIFAVSGLAVYGVVLGSWASNNKYSFLGGLRASAQLISYEIPLGLGILGIVLMSGSLEIDHIIRQQSETGIWNVFSQPLGFVVFATAAFAEAGRLPFDLAEAEQELVGGFHTEYSGMKLMMYLVSEFLHMFVAAFLMVYLFFGGWHLWGLPTGGEQFVNGQLVQGATWWVAILRIVILLGKVFAIILFFMVARWSWPRFRFDQVMDMAWKVMIPLGLVHLVFVAVWVEYGGRLSGSLFGESNLMMVVAGWGVLIVTWLVVTLLLPNVPDNRPRRGPVSETRIEEGSA